MPIVESKPMIVGGLAWVLFDLNGTLLDPRSIADPLGGGEEDRQLVAGAFTDALLVTMADALSGGPCRTLADYFGAMLERALRGAGFGTDTLEKALERADAMAPFPDARAALCDLADAGLHIGVLTNSTSSAADKALSAAGLRDLVEVVIGTEATGAVKPQPAVYEHAATTLGVAPAEVCLIAAHDWDVMGAMRAGMRGGWIARAERWLEPIDPDPDLQGEGLSAIVGGLMSYVADIRGIASSRSPR
jgi:2-haloacid dehalogenase